jgi:FkbM family methyltransferase
MFGNTHNLESHLNYTKNEWVNSQYYKKVLDFLEEKKIKNFMDVGACSGGISDIFFAGIQSLKKCIMVEPIEDNYNFIVNRFGNDSKRLVINKAVYYNSPTINIGQVGSNVGGYSFQSSINSIEFPTITIEDIVRENRNFLEGDIDFIKIDIEGAEYNLIQNSEILRTIPYIEVEFHNNPEYNIDTKTNIRHDVWGQFMEKYLPNHRLVYGGKNEKVIWPNGLEVVYDGSGFFVLKGYE